MKFSKLVGGRENLNALMKFFCFIPDKQYLKIMYRLRMGKKLNLKNPSTFNEKLQWMKLNDRKPVYTQMVDKQEAKVLVADAVGDKYVVPTLGIWERFEDIDFTKMPNQFVLKCTHDSGGLVICKDKDKLDLESAKRKIKRSLKCNFYWVCREWPYKNVKPRIIAEKYMQDGANDCLPVYKVFCFNGEPKIIQAIQNDKHENESIDYFDTDWNLLKMKQNYPNSSVPLGKPDKLSEMVDLARTLSEGHSFLRVDFYVINGEVYFSEFTFYSDAGMAKFEPEEWDVKLGEWVELI